MSRSVDVLQIALAAEHAVVWGYAVVGARADPGLRAAVLAADQAHRGRRDATTALVRRLGGDPTPSLAAYALPFAVPDRVGALRLAVHLEEGDAAAWRYMIAAGVTAALRAFALAGLTDAAVRAAGWRVQLTPAAPSVPFPGQ